MSQKYEWLYNTTYPDKIQEFEEKLNITPNDATLIKQIQSLIEQKRFAEANELRKQVVNYKQKEIIAQDWNTMSDTVVALQLEYDSRYTPNYVLSKDKPTNQSEGDYWYRITNVKYFGETEEIGTGEKSPENPYELKGLKVPNTDLELFALPNGVVDEYDENSKIYTKRVGKVVLKGSEGWYRQVSDTGKDVVTRAFALKNNTAKNYGYLVCDKFINTTASKLWDSDIQGTSSGNISNPNVLIIKLNRDFLKLLGNSDDVNVFKQWLSQNPVTVLYELETPEIIQL